MTAKTLCRYIVWRDDTRQRGGGSLVEILSRFSSVEVLRAGNSSAVILADPEDVEAIRRETPEVTIEPDLQFRRA